MTNVFNDEKNVARVQDEAAAPLAWPWSQYKGEFPGSESAPIVSEAYEPKPLASHFDREESLAFDTSAPPPRESAPANMTRARSFDPLAIAVAAAIIIVGGFAWWRYSTVSAARETAAAPTQEQLPSMESDVKDAAVKSNMAPAEPASSPNVGKVESVVAEPAVPKSPDATPMQASDTPAAKKSAHKKHKKSGAN